MQEHSIRWGILGTANIARSAFLPALRAAGGVAYAVAGRELARTREFAEANEIDHPSAGYESLLADDYVQAVYVPLPNALHAEWTVAALRAGKAVLCEKPLCVSLTETEQLLEAARGCDAPLWEAFVFPFLRQTSFIQDLVARGEIGELREIQADFHFALNAPHNIRFDPALGGGGLYDVGCYCIRFARLLMGEPSGGVALARWTSSGVDGDLQGALEFPGNKRLLFSCGMDRPADTFARVIGSEGELRLSNPYHPRAADTVEIRRGDDIEIQRPSNDEPTFTEAIRHIHGVLRGEESPRHLALDDAAGNAAAIDLLYQRARENTPDNRSATL